METDAYPLPGEFPHHQAAESCSLLLSAFDDTNLTFLPTQHPRPDMSRASPPSLARGEPCGRSQEMEPGCPKEARPCSPPEQGFPPPSHSPLLTWGQPAPRTQTPRAHPSAPARIYSSPGSRALRKGLELSESSRSSAFLPIGKPHNCILLRDLGKGSIKRQL